MLIICLGQNKSADLPGGDLNLFSAVLEGYSAVSSTRLVRTEQWGWTLLNLHKTVMRKNFRKLVHASLLQCPWDLTDLQRTVWNLCLQKWSAQQLVALKTLLCYCRSWKHLRSLLSSPFRESLCSYFNHSLKGSQAHFLEQAITLGCGLTISCSREGAACHHYSVIHDQTE